MPSVGRIHSRSCLRHIAFSFAGALYAASVVLVLSSAAAFGESTDNGPLIRVEMAGNELAIPRRYFPLDFPTTKHPSGLFLMALYPTLDPMRKDNKDLFLHDHNFENTVYIVAQDASTITSLEYRINVTRRLGAPYAREPDKYGLEFYAPIEGKNVQPTTPIRDEIYALRAGNILSTFITCVLNGSVPAPSCDQEFDYRGIWLKVSYGKQHLPEWKTIEASVKNLIDIAAKNATQIHN